MRVRKGWQLLFRDKDLPAPRPFVKRGTPDEPLPPERACFFSGGSMSKDEML